MPIYDGLLEWLNSIRDKRQQKFMLKIKGALERMNNEQVYNPYKYGLPSSLSDDNKLSRQITENFVWYSADQSAIEDFYKGRTGQTENSNEASFFWYASPDDGSIMRIHAGLPKLISDTMATVLFGNGFKFGITVYKKDEQGMITDEVDENESKRITETLNLLVKQKGINIARLLERSAVKESWAGDVAWKIAIDTNLSPYPILMAYDPRNYEPLVMKGVDVGITFKDYRDVKDVKGKEQHFCIKETYTTDSVDDTSLIVYELYQMKESGVEVKVPLDTIEDSDLQRLLNDTGVEVSEDRATATIRFNGLKGMLAWHKPNRVNTADDYYSKYGESDFTGNYANFNGIDEVVSTIVEEARLNKTVRYIPTDMLARDSSGKFQRFNEFVRNYREVKSNPDQNANNQITFSQFNDKTMDHLKKYETMLGLVCANSKISPLTLGLTNVVGMANSDKTLQERSKVTVETRKKKLELWQDFLEQALYKLLEVYWFMWESYPDIRKKAMIEAVKADEKQMNINVSFPDYSEMGLLDRATRWSSIYTSGGISTEQYVEQIYGDEKTIEDKAKEVSRLKIEKNIALNNPDVLSLNDLDDEQDTEPENDNDEDNR